MLPKKISEIIDNNVKITSKNLEFKKDFFGFTPSPFIGRFGYPNINIGIMSAINPDDVNELDNPKLWASSSKKINDIIGIRSSLINSRRKSNIKTKQDKLKDLVLEVGMASKAAEVEINLKYKPHFNLNISQYSTVHGPNVQLDKAKLTSNTKISTKVEKAYDDTDLKATEAVYTLYKKGIDENHLSQIMSVGAVGIKTNRKLVPTRWSITAIDNTISNELLKEVKLLDKLDNYQLYFSGYLGNYYLILFFPEVFSYELFECSLENSDSYSTDFETFKKRTKYSDSCEGGYYTVRLALEEKMKKLNKQATAIVFRFITKEYSVPLGVWVTREASRRALLTKCFEFNSKKEMINMARKIALDDFDFNLDKLLLKSILYKNLKVQRKLFDF